MEHSAENKYISRIRRLRLMDDTFFAACLAGDNQSAELMLQILLDKSDLRVTSMRTQYTIKNLLGHSVTFDAYATDSHGRKYDIEIQRDNRGAIPQRARYHSSMIDGRILVENEKYQELAETYVIFITEHDVLGEGLALYHIERNVAETGKPFGDGAHIVYVNAGYDRRQKPGDKADRHDLSPLEKLIHDLRCINPNDMYYDILAQKARYFKQDEKGVSHMCEIMEEMCEEVRQETMAAAEAKFAKEIEKLTQEKAEAEARLTQEKAEAEMRLSKEREKLTQEKAEAEARLTQEKAEAEMRLSKEREKLTQEKAEAEARLTQEKAEAEMRLSKEREKLTQEKAEAEMRLSKEKERSEEAMKSAIKMIKDGLKAEKISEYTGMPVEKVIELAELIA